MDLDIVLFRALNGLTGQWRILDWGFIFLADHLAYFLAAAAVIFILRAGHWRKRWFVFAESALAVILGRGIVVELIRFFYNRPRPFVVFQLDLLVGEVHSGSFPSGHAVFFFALACVFWFWNRRFGAWFFAASLLMGIARVASGVHWPTDIAGGIVVALIGALAARALLSSFYTEQKNNSADSGAVTA